MTGPSTYFVGARMVCMVLVGDCRERLAEIPAKSVHTVVTSRPYFGLRDYGHGEQIGLETTPEDFVTAMVTVFREVRRVLRDDGTVWLNLGDSYSGSGKGVWNVPDEVKRAAGIKETYRPSTDAKRKADRPAVSKTVDGLKPKDLIGIPWRVAFALQADGWYLRQDIIWAKPNPMPESVRDRCTKAHEYIFLLSKSPSYYFDHEAIKEPAVVSDRPSVKQGGFAGKGAIPGTGQASFRAVTDTRAKRDVWTVATKPFKDAHFATFPPALIEPCVLAGAPVGGIVLDPFGGAGTTGLVAEQHGRDSFLIELNPEYAAMIVKRLNGAAVLL